MGRNWFSNRMVDELNRLSNDIVSAKMIAAEKED